MKGLVLGIALAVLPSVPALAGDAEAGANVFRKCMACHAVGEGAQNRVGPPLNGIVGRPAATAPNYSYSNTMKEKAAGGLVWTPEMLSQFLVKPRAFIEGTKMAFAGLSRPEDVENVIAYLSTIAADGSTVSPPAQ